jgi:hypothetical protein
MVILDVMQLKIPSFQCKNDPEASLKWEKKVDWIFIGITIRVEEGKIGSHGVHRLRKVDWIFIGITIRVEEGKIGSHGVHRLCTDLVGSKCD